jgi:serine O-acetyltransferase
MVIETLRTAVECVREDVCTALEKDPAAKSTLGAFTYPGLHAVWLHRVEHALWERGHPFLARTLSQVTRFLTGVEIHPAAEVGRRVFIDHGMGVVIGETAKVGDDVHMFHGVTLGGDDPRPVKRHPTVRDGATLGANSTLIGDIIVGQRATVGAGSVVVEDVPPGVTVAGNPATAAGGDTQAPASDDVDGSVAEDTEITAAADGKSAGEWGWLSC